MRCVQVLTRRHMRGSPTNCILAAIAAANLLTSAVCVQVYVHFYLVRDKALPPLATRSLPWAAYLWLQVSGAFCCTLYSTPVRVE